MNPPQTWLQTKLTEPCACASGRTYQKCCYRRESIYFIIGVSTGFALIGANHLPWLAALVPLLLTVAFAAKFHYDRKRDRYLRVMVPSFPLQPAVAPLIPGPPPSLFAFWAVFGAAFGFIACIPLAILMTRNSQTMTPFFQDWSWPAFVTLNTLAFAAIPFAALCRLRSGLDGNWSRLMRRSLTIAAVAFALSALSVLITFDLVHSSWHYHHPGTPDCFLLAIPLLTAMAILASGLLKPKAHALPATSSH